MSFLSYVLLGRRRQSKGFGRSSAASSAAKKRRHNSQSRSLRLEPLEDRSLLSVSPVFVDANWTGPGNCGGHNWGVDAFATIQAGVNAVSSGGTVNVDAGAYNEVVTIDGFEFENTTEAIHVANVIDPSGAQNVTVLNNYVNNDVVVNPSSDGINLWQAATATV